MWQTKRINPIAIAWAGLLLFGACTGDSPGADEPGPDSGIEVACEASEPQVIDASGQTGGYPTVALGPDGVLHVIYSDYSTWQLKHAFREPMGEWTVETIPASGMFSKLHVAQDGTLQLLFHDFTAGDLRYAQRDPGDDWRFETVADQGAGEMLYVYNPGTYVDEADGSVHASFYSFEGNFVYARRAEDGTWESEVVDPTNSRGEYGDVVVDSSGTLHALYQDREDIAGTLVYASRPPDGMWSIDVLDGISGGDFISLVVDADDGLHAAFSQEPSPGSPRAGGITYATRPSGGPWSATMIDSGSEVGANLNLVIDRAGEIHVSYHGDGELRYARGRDEWTIVVPDDGASGNVAWDSALAIAPNGETHIAYGDHSNWVLKYVSVCPDAE